MPLCKFCEKEISKLSNSHIVPKAFYEAIKKSNETEYLLSITNTPGLYTQKSWIGLYDQIVCASCEELFSPYDNYAINLLLQTHDFEVIKHATKGLGVWKKDKYDYNKLKLFFLTLLWRAGASTMHQFKRVQLGAHLDKVRENIRNNNPGTEHDYSVLLARFEENDEIGRNFVLDPHLESRKAFDGINIYRFYLGAGYVAYIKVDKRQLKGIFTHLILSPHNPLYIYNRGYVQNSNEFKLLKELASK